MPDSVKVMDADKVEAICWEILRRESINWYAFLSLLADRVVKDGFGWNVEPRHYTRIAERVWAYR